ncbi:MAG: HAMP domain-containing protein [Acidobacteriota bacterium]|nr:HAMP domain-containing protein [Acidobacteriota bacterium]MDE3190401.1 HAMP domain-containing protein [Acidobacteriota bacterium]
MTIRLRLTLIYGGLFLVSAAALLAITYVLVNRQYTSTFFVRSGRNAVVMAQNAKGLREVGPVPKGFPVPVGPKMLVTNEKLAIAAAQGQSDAATHKLFVDSAFALGVMSLLSLWLGWVIAGRALRPLRTITETTREISASNLHRRLDLEGPDDELKRLGNTVDGLLGRLETSFEAQRQFVANASHELRTPLTLERTLLELALSDPNASIESYRHTCEQLLAVGEQQERLIEALLTLSRSQRGLDSHQPVDLAAIAAAAVAAVDRDGLAFGTAIGPANTTGNPRLVERLVANLVGNAVDHNVDGGTVSLSTETRGGRAVLTVANSGPAIPPAELDRLFQPFQRLEGSRTHSHGLGLGLSIVKAIADAHDATITTRALADGGLQVQVGFPAS